MSFVPVLSALCRKFSGVTPQAGLGHMGMLNQSPSPRMMIGSKKKEPDMSLNPKGGGFGNGMLDNGFGFPFPNLVVEVASSGVS